MSPVSDSLVLRQAGFHHHLEIMNDVKKKTMLMACLLDNWVRLTGDLTATLYLNDVFQTLCWPFKLLEIKTFS